MSDHSHCIHDVHRYGLRHSLNDGISCTTNVTIVTKPVSVPGYGKNHASALSGSGARILVTECDPSAPSRRSLRVCTTIRPTWRFPVGVVSKSLQEVLKLRRKSRT